MLVLSRKVDEVIRIGNDVRVTIVKIKGDSARLGFEAPSNVPIYREEVYQAILRDKEAKDATGHAASRLSTSKES